MKKSSLMEKILKNSPTKHASVLSESVMFKDKDIITTDVPIINIAFSGELGGGISSGLSLLAGPSKVFKSNLALICVKAFLNKYPDSVCILYDSEGGITPEYLRSLGVDPDRVVHVPIEHIEMLKFDLVKQLKEFDRNDKVIIVIDSIGNTASLKELEDAINEKNVAEMQRAKSIKGLFRMVTPSLVAKDIPCIAICHTYSEMSLYPKQIISGGCLLQGTKIQMFDKTLKVIEDVFPGDLVSTLDGPKIVTHSWNPDTLEDGEPECYKITFEDGYEVTCSEGHPFLLNGEYVCAKDLVITNNITTIDTTTCTITKIEKVGKQKVYDITVADNHQYILENGAVTHNSGLIYSANQAFIISKSQEKDGTDLVGWNFTINIEKSRFVREKAKLPFLVTYENGVQKYSGLLELALEAGLVVKPSNGWYSKVDTSTGEMESKKYRAKETFTEEFWKDLLIAPAFNDFIKGKFQLSASVLTDESIEAELAEVELD